MNTIWKWCLMTVTALAFAQAWAVEAVDPEEEAARQVDETMRQVNQARSTWNVERAFCFRVVDATGKPVPEVPVFFMASEFVNGAALWQNLNKKDERAKTDADGYMRFAKRKLGTVTVSLPHNDMPDGLESEKSGNYVFGERGPQSVELIGTFPKPATAPGVDAIFLVHRYRGPHPLWESRSGINGLPVDGQPIGWKPLSPTEWSTPLLGDALARTQPQLILRLWRDPAEKELSYIEPLDYDPRGIPMYIPANTWMEVVMPIGGLRRIDARNLDPMLHIEAPVDGYVDRLQWKYIAQKTQDSTIGNKAIFWLKIGPDPSYYGTAELEIDWKPTRIPKTIQVNAALRIILNPTPGDRLIERSLGRDEIWVTNATRKQRQGLCERFPTNGKPLPGIAIMPPLELGWPGDAVPEFSK